MEFSIPVQELAKALQRVQGIIEKKTTMPILANVLLEASKDGFLSVAATNLESTESACDVAQEGSCSFWSFTVRYCSCIAKEIAT